MTSIRLHLCLLAVFATVLSARCSGQGLGAETKNVLSLPTQLKGRDPKPEDATTAILAAFDKYEIVGMPAAHGAKDLDDLILRLVRAPSFPNRVNDIVVECGNSLYQPVLDRYIAGEEVGLAEVQAVWRNTTQPMCSVSGFYEILFPLVRRINQRLSGGKKLRVLAGDPPLDWSKVKEQSQVMLDRDAHIASVMKKEVLSKHRKALMLFGTFHLFHSDHTGPKQLESSVGRYEMDYPGVTLVIGTGVVSRSPIPVSVMNEVEARMAGWPVPSLIQNIKGTWLEDVDEHYFSGMVDAFLYLGPTDLMLVEPRPAEVFLNKEYMKELRRRAGIIGEGLITAQTDPNQISDQYFSPFLFYPTAPNKSSQSAPIGLSSPVVPSGEEAPRRTPDPPRTIHLSLEKLATLAGRYAFDPPSGSSAPPIEIVADRDGLWIDLGAGTGRRKFVPVSAVEFMESDAPEARIIFTQDNEGRTVGLIFKGLWTSHATKLP